jgi:hypothetical protein
MIFDCFLNGRAVLGDTTCFITDMGAEGRFCSRSVS